MLKGALHVHSTHSDGEFTIEELRHIYAAEGCGFVCMNDHAQYFDARTIASYVRELQQHSDARFCFVMGLEYECERRMHILGFGASVLANTADPQAVIRHIHSQGAVSVIAHPKDEHFSWIESFDVLPAGIEAWNSKYDGRYAPRPGTFALLQRLKQRSPEIHAFYGQDLHWKKQFRGLCVLLDCQTPDSSGILAALAAGKFTGQKDGFQLLSSGVLSAELLQEFSRVHARSHKIRQFLKRQKQMLDRLGVRVPESLKAQLRRIF
jgi:predicted metal-dependent phosphoesterase TrpH